MDNTEPNLTKERTETVDLTEVSLKISTEPPTFRQELTEVLLPTLKTDLTDIVLERVK